MKKLLLAILSILFSISCLTHNESYAALKDIKLLGGSYDDVFNEKTAYKEQNPKDEMVYECHHLISKESLNLWGDHLIIKRKEKINVFNEFLLKDLSQGWAPSIIMEKADHERTLSYYNLKTKTYEENQNAIKYIELQADRIIDKGDIIGVLKDETNFIRKTFGNKYDKGLDQVWRYIRSLTFRHPNSHELTMTHPYNSRWFFSYKF